jgi:hypothetical protein
MKLKKKIDKKTKQIVIKRMMIKHDIKNKTKC